MHFADVIEGVGLQVLDVVQLGELAAIVGGDELVELLEGLLAQVVAVHQEEHAFGPGMLNQAVDEVDGGEGFAAAGRHLDQGARPVGGEGGLQMGDGFNLGFPKVLGKQGEALRHLAQSGAERAGLGRPLREGLGTMEGEDAPRTGLGVAVIAEEGFYPGAFIQEGQGQGNMRDIGGQADGITRGLLGNPGQRHALGFGFDNAHGVLVDE